MERKKDSARKEEQKETREAEWKKEVTFFFPLARTFEVGQDGEGRRGPLCEGKGVRRKQGEDRVNEMASKDELNGGRKETRSGWALLIDSSQTHSFERR